MSDWDQLLQAFESGPDVASRWDAARRLMAQRALTKAAQSELFLSGINAVALSAKAGHGVDRLLAVDLLVRLSNYLKGLWKQTEPALREALQRELPDIALINDAGVLPPEAKAADVRENIALALAYASDSWAASYIIRALMKEDRSQRCRSELLHQLALRDRSVNSWFANLSAEIGAPLDLATAADKLGALAVTVKTEIAGGRRRLDIDDTIGADVAAFARRFVSTVKGDLPANLEKVSIALCELLDELLTSKLTLIIEAEAYEPLIVLKQWWQPLSYPSGLQEALVPVQEKILSGITLRAKMGQKSEGLSNLLRQVSVNKEVAESRIKEVADSLPGLPPEVEDWLRGRQRSVSSTADKLRKALQGVTSDEGLLDVARALLDALEVKKALSEDGVDKLVQNLETLVHHIEGLGRSRNLEVFDRVGESVEYSPHRHQTVSGAAPQDPEVRVLRPGILRRRHDGGQDVIVRGLVEGVKQ